MKDNQEALESQLSSFFAIHLSRLKCLSSLILGMIHVRSVNFAEVCLCLNGSVKSASNYKRIQRFFRLFVFPFDSLSLLIWQLYATDDEVVLSLDRTNWKFGRANINILMLSICHHGIAIPLMWKVLGNKRGNSSTEERIELMQRFVKVIAPEFIVRLVADREFIGQEWLQWLDTHYFHFVIRLRKNQLVNHIGRKEVKAHQLFASTQMRTLRKARFISGVELYIGGKALEKDKYLILISNLPLKKGLFYYAQRWEIEVLFAALKSRGFDFEATHMTKAERIDKLIAVLTIALAWAVKVGDFISNKGKNIPIKKHNKKAKSVFRVGLDKIRIQILNFRDLNDLIKLLSCT